MTSLPKSFPAHFLWGSATSAFQVEGYPLADGALESIWTHFCQEPGRVANGQTADVSSDHYHHFRDDSALMKSLGMGAYRFSVSMSRLMTLDGMKLIYNDTTRVMMLRNCLTHLQRATAEGIPVKGYFHWSLMDNFEWQEGYTPRFGLVHCDYATGQRIPKLSARLFSTIAKNNCLM